MSDTDRDLIDLMDTSIPLLAELKLQRHILTAIRGRDAVCKVLMTMQGGLGGTDGIPLTSCVGTNSTDLKKVP
jgi:hypothetical protein